MFVSRPLVEFPPFRPSPKQVMKQIRERRNPNPVQKKKTPKGG